MLISITSRAIILACLFIVVCMPGCMAFYDSAAMRIEVEVYKGPLSLEPETQLGELYGYLIEAHNGLLKTSGLIDDVLKQHDCPTEPVQGKPTEPVQGKPTEPVQGKPRPINCSILSAIQKDTLSYQQKLTIPICLLNPSAKTGQSTTCASDALSQEDQNKQKAFNENLSSQKMTSIPITDKPGTYREALIEAGRIATVMQAGAFRYATASSAGQTWSWDVRIVLTYLITASSEYGNQIQARSEALLKQLGEYGRDRRELPLSAHLRETAPTDFMHLFDWMDGHMPRIYDYLTLNFSPNIEDRIKIVERLYADHFWSKINTVYAGGRGQTQMAFIKDETGNWNLKSFANDPTDLLDAYTTVAKAALKNAANIAASAATGGTSSASLVFAKQLRDFASESEPDQAIAQTSPAGTLSLTHLRSRLADKLDPAFFTADLEEEKKLLKEVNGKDPDAAKTAQPKLFQHRQQVIARWEAILNDHSNLVDILSSTVKKK